jgi:uncharacterized RDD family membrane protein YckC
MVPSFDLQALDIDDGPLDTRVRLVTPERIVFEFPLAGPFPRFRAYLIDQVCVLLILLVSIVAVLVVSLGSESSLGVVFVVYFLLNWGYGAFLEGMFNGRTIGKTLTGLRVVTDQGVPISGVQAIVRNVVGAVDGLLPFFYLSGLASMFLTRKFQRLGDLAAGTMVVHEESRGRRAIIRIEEPAVRAVVERLPVRLAAGSQLTRALTDYVRHRHRFGEARRAEMAEPLARPLRAWLGLGDEVSADTVLCAVYHRVLVGE